MDYNKICMAFVVIGMTVAALACDDGGIAMMCVPGRVVACDCDNGEQGIQTCLEDGTDWDSCSGCGDEGGDADTDMDLLSMSRKQLELLSKKYPDIRDFLSEMITHRLSNPKGTADRKIGK